MSAFSTTVLAQPEQISELTGQLLSFLEQQEVEPRAAHHVTMIVEELLTNIGTHGGCADQPVRLDIAVEPTQVTGEIVDRSPPFNPHEAPHPDLDSSAEERNVGGLGLFLVRQFASSLEYAHRNGENHTRFVVPRG